MSVSPDGHNVFTAAYVVQAVAWFIRNKSTIELLYNGRNVSADINKFYKTLILHYNNFRGF